MFMKSTIIFLELFFFISQAIAQSEQRTLPDRHYDEFLFTSVSQVENSNTEPDSIMRTDSAGIADSLINKTIQILYATGNSDKDGIDMDAYDKIITFDNEVYIVKIQNITLTEVRFVYPLNTRLETLNRQKISQIIYCNNSIDLFTPFDMEKTDLLPVQDERLIVDERKAWEKIHISEDMGDVEGMIEIGPVTAAYTADRIQISDNYLEKNGLIILKRRAANLGADFVLITGKSVSNGYGDNPAIKIEGIAYKRQL